MKVSPLEGWQPEADAFPYRFELEGVVVTIPTVNPLGQIIDAANADVDVKEGLGH